MSLSTKTGIPIALIKGGKNKSQDKVYYNTTHVDLDDDDYTEEDFERDLEAVEPMLYNRTGGEQLNAKQSYFLYEALQEKERPTKDFKMMRFYDAIMDRIRARCGKELYLQVGKFVPIPYIDPNEHQADSMFIVGPRGSGKSTMASSYIEHYHKQFPKNKVILFSAKDEDPALDKFKYLKRFVIDDSWLDDDDEEKGTVSAEPNVSELANSLVVMDDICAIKNKKIRMKVEGLRDKCLSLGRSSNIYVVSTAHILRNGHETRYAIQECDQFVFFPERSSKMHIKSFLKEHLGYTSDEIKRIVNVKGRWVLVRRYPKLVISESEAYLI